MGYTIGYTWDIGNIYFVNGAHHGDTTARYP